MIRIVHEVHDNEIRFRRLIDDIPQRSASPVVTSIKIDVSIYRIRDARTWMSKQLSETEYTEYPMKLNSLIFTNWEFELESIFRAILENNTLFYYIIIGNSWSFEIFVYFFFFKSNKFFNYRSTFNIDDIYSFVCFIGFFLFFFLEKTYNQILSLENDFLINNNDFIIYVSSNVFLIILSSL